MAADGQDVRVDSGQTLNTRPLLVGKMVKDLTIVMCKHRGVGVYLVQTAMGSLDDDI